MFSQICLDHPTRYKYITSNFTVNNVSNLWCSNWNTCFCSKIFISHIFFCTSIYKGQDCRHCRVLWSVNAGRSSTGEQSVQSTGSTTKVSFTMKWSAIAVAQNTWRHIVAQVYVAIEFLTPGIYEEERYYGHRCSIK